MNVEKKNFSNFPLGNKKGIFFTFAAIVLSIVIIFSFNVYTGYRLKDKMEVTEIRINTMNNFIKDLENDMGNAIYISGFRSLLSLEDYMMENNKFFGEDGAPSLAAAFGEVFRYGTIDSEKMSLMEGNTFLNWTERMKVEANKTGINLEFNVDSVSISHTSPWIVEITVQLDITVNDKKGIASWAITNEDYTGQINITSEDKAGIDKDKFVDPLYLVNTNGLVNNTIRETPYSDWPNDLSSHLNGYYYIENSDAPSYLMRFENDLSSDSNGIESLVTDRLKDEGYSLLARSAVDYIYFVTPGGCNVVDVVDTDFYLDDPAHTGFYSTSCV